MIDELERLCPEELDDLKTILDKLNEMQHYFLPTRLLDISDALVALFFACQELKKDGEVITLQGEDSSAPGERKKANVCYVHSDKVSLLTGISQMNYTDQLLLYYVTDFFNDFVKDRNNDRDFWLINR